MSPKRTRKRKTTTRARRKPGQTSASVISGAALVVASVIPAALHPGPPPTRRSEPPVAITPAEPRPRRPTRRTTLAFEPECDLPFDAIKTSGLTIDETCSPNGNAGDDIGKRLESNAKNNFCVGDSPVPITYQDFIDLETTADNIGNLRKQLKTSRDRLVDIVTQSDGTRLGEGRVVQFVGFLFDAHFSNKGKGELVNCKLPRQENNDIHIELMKDAMEKDPCNSVTAEMSPHFRPEAWNDLVGLEIDRPIRITGPLFFDGSHHPCHDDVRVSPNRISVWEVHPVYQFEVCKFNEKTVSKCDVKNNSVWIPLDQWHSTEEEEEEEEE